MHHVQAAEHVANTIQAAHPDKPRPRVTLLATARNDLALIPTAAGDQLVRLFSFCRDVSREMKKKKSSLLNSFSF